MGGIRCVALAICLLAAINQSGGQEMGTGPLYEERAIAGKNGGKPGLTFGHMYGGKERVPTTDKDVVSVARWSATELDGVLMSIQSAERQVVAGMKYYIRLTLDKRAELTNCVYKMHCRVVVWTRVWIHSRLLLSYWCTNHGTNMCS